MTMQQPPEQITVGQSIYAVQIRRLDRRLGLTQLREQRIRLDPKQGTGSMRDTMMHEALHAIWQESSAAPMLGVDDDAEEKMIRLFTPWLLMLLRDNPDLIAYLTGPGEVA